MKHTLFAAVFLATCSLPTRAACPSDEEVMAYVQDLSAARPSKGFGKGISGEDAECAKNKLTQKLPPVLGRVVGYKAAFTSEANQKRFGVASPAWGVMYANLMVASGMTLPARFGAKPLYEADFVAIVKDPGLADAKTQLEALKHIEAFAPFMELPDLMLESKDFSGAELIAINLGFRGGALGPPVKAEATPAFVDKLANMTVVLTEETSGKEVARAKGTALMEHPVNAAMWLAQALKKAGIALKPGDLLSLGGYSTPFPAAPNTRVTVKYFDLPGDPAVTVHFE